MRKILLLSSILFISIAVNAQSGFVFSCTRDTVISCAQNCITLQGYIPNIHSVSDDYDVSSLNSGFCTIQMPSSNVQGTPTNIEDDDQYTQVIPLPFDFPFYGIFYAQLIASSNGIISFDDAEATNFSHYGILSNGFGLSAGTGSPVDLPSTLYDRALIMGPYHDIDIGAPTSPNKKIYYQVDGVAPYRRWILGFFEIPLFLTSCNSLYHNSHEIILNESTGIIDIRIFDKQICTGWNEGRAMVGMQNYDRDKGIMAPGRAASDNPWGSIGMNEAWRFTPKNGPSLFQRVELLDMSGTVISTGDTTSVTNSVFSVSFPNICPTGTTSYVIKSTYLKFDDPSVEVYGYDTVNVIKNSAVPAVTVDTTKALCGSNGTITVTAPLGANYEYSIDNGVTYQPTTVFSVPPGLYTVLVHDKTGTCTNSKNVEITSVGALTATATSVNTSCPGVDNGTISVDVSVGIPGFTFLIDTMTIGQSDSLFINLAAGTHTITVKDNGNCSYTFTKVVGSDPGFTTTAVASNASCLGVANGSIAVTVPSSGTAPFEYSVPGFINVPQLSTNLNGLAGGATYTVKVEDANGCTYSFSKAVVNSAGVTATFSTINSACSGVSTGQIVIKPTAGSAPFTYSTDGGTTYIALDTVRNLASGTYNLKVKDAVGCVYDSPPVTVSNNIGVTATFATINSACSGVSTGQIVITPTAGSAPFTYSANGGSTYITLDTVRNLASGSYNLKVKDAVGCIYDSPPVTVNNNIGVTATFSTINSACSGVSTGQIVIKPTAGSAPFTYSTDGGTTYIALDTVRNLASGSYNLKVKDAVGCIYDSPPVTVNNNIGVTATFSTINSACSGVSTGQIVIKPTAGSAPFTYSTDGGTTYITLDTVRNLASGSYNLKVKDAVGCIYDSPPVTVNNGIGVTATFSTINSACSGVSTGQIVIKPTAGSAPFTYSTDGGTTYIALDTVRNLASGSYNLKVKDAVGCIYDSPPVTVNNGIGVTATFSTINSACSGVSTGQIVIKPTAGSAPFTYSTNGGTTYIALDTVRNLASGSYNLKVKDAVGCIYDSPPVTVNNGIGVTATFSTINSACSVASTGKIITVPTNGIAPFVISTDGGTTYLPLDTIRNLAGGTYNLKVKDAVGCVFDSPVITVNSNTPGVGATFASINSACSGVSTGQIIITPTIGVSPFRYSIDGGVTFPALDTIRNLAGGSYNLKVRDALGCTYDPPAVTVNNNIGVTATASTVNSACSVASTGQIIIKPTAGTAPFTYSTNGGSTYIALDTIKNLTGAIYNIKLKDVVGCIYDIPAITVNSNSPGLSATFASVNASCTGVSNGKIVITPTSGQAPFSYSTDGGVTFPALDTIRNLAGGSSYNIKVKDALGCTFDAAPVAVNNNIGVTATYTLVKSACSGVATGAIIIKATTGSPAFKYSLDAGATYQNDSVFRQLASNTYTVRVIDAAGCILNSPAQNLTDNPGVLTNASTIKNASCASVPNGSITINASAGIAPFSYINTSVPGATTQPGSNFGGLFAGNYDIKITDSAGCTKTITVVVGNNPKVKIDALDRVSPTCKGLLNGSVTVTASLGVAPYQFAIDTNPYSNSKTFSGIGAGPHIIHVKDANSCIIDSAIVITEPALLTTALVSTTKATCSGNPDGQIVVSAAGGTTPYQYTLDGAALTGYQSASSFPVIAGSYKVTVEDAKNCKATVNVVVDSVFTMFLDLGRDTTICAEQAFVFQPNTNAETSIFTYSPASSIDKPTIKNPSATPADTTTYSLTATWGICSLTDNIKVSVLRKPVAHAGLDVVICFDTTIALKASATNVSGPVNYSWSPASFVDGKADTTDVVARPKDMLTYYTVTVKDDYGCNFSVTDSVLVNMLPKVYAFAGNDTNAVLDKPHQLFATGAGIGGTYEWTYPSAGISLVADGTNNQPAVTFTRVPGLGTFAHPDTNYYILSVKAINQAGCSAIDSIKIHVFIGPTYYVPNAFSPNGDGFNDEFKAILVGISKTEYFRVFNRYGQVVFETNRFMEGWDGKFKGTDQPSGNYVWVLRGLDKNGRPVERKGSVLLIR